MFGIGGTELLIIIIFGFLVFGPDKLPQMAKTFGLAIRKFREISAEAKGIVNVQDIIDGKEEISVSDSIDALSRVKDKAVDSALEVSKSAKEAYSKKEAEVTNKTSADAKTDKDVNASGDSDEKEPETLAEKKARYDREHPKKDEDKSALEEVK